MGEHWPEKKRQRERWEAIVYLDARRLFAMGEGHGGTVC
jgi:hypothetical protein